MLQLSNGSPVLSPDAVVSMALQTTNENPVEFASGDVRSQRITRDHPISRIRFVLRGTATVGAGSAITLSSLGLANLIANVRIARNGNQDIVNVPGRVLPAMHVMATKQDHFEKLPTLTASAVSSFVAAFDVTLDVGGYTSLLDATGDQSLDVEVTWGTVASIVKTGTATLSNVKLDIVPMVVTGALPGERGGIGAPYFRNHVTYADQPVTQSQADFRFDLVSGRGYHGLTLFAMSENLFSDGVINAVTLERQNANNIRLEWDEIRAMNHDRFLLGPDEFVGVLDVPFIDPGHFEHTLSIRPSQSMRLVLDVNHPGAIDSIGLLQSYFRNPGNG